MPETTGALAERIAWHLIGKGWENRYHRYEGTVSDQVKSLAEAIAEKLPEGMQNA